MLFYIFSVVGDAAGSDAGLSHQLKADLSTQVVWDLTLLLNTRETQPHLLNDLCGRCLHSISTEDGGAHSTGSSGV